MTKAKRTSRPGGVRSALGLLWFNAASIRLAQVALSLKPSALLERAEENDMLVLPTLVTAALTHEHPEYVKEDALAPSAIASIEEALTPDILATISDNAEDALRYALVGPKAVELKRRIRATYAALQEKGVNEALEAAASATPATEADRPNAESPSPIRASSTPPTSETGSSPTTTSSSS